MTSPSTPPPQLEQDRRHFDDAELSPAELDAMFRTLRAQTLDRTPTLRDRIRESSISQRSLVVVGGAGVLGALLVAVQQLRADLSVEVATAVGPRLLLLALAASATLPVTVRGLTHPISATLRNSTVGLALLVPVLIALSPGGWPGMALPTEAGWAPALRCSAASAVAALLTMTLVIVVHPVDRPHPWRLASAAGAGGALGFIVQTLTCPAADLAHVVVAHGAMGIMVAMGMLALHASHFFYRR